MSKKLLMGFLLLFVGATCHPSHFFYEDQEKEDVFHPAADKGLKKKVAIFEFWNDSGKEYSQIGLIATQELEKQLTNTDQVKIFKTKESYYTKDFSANNLPKIEQISRLGQNLGVSAIIIGKISNIVFRNKKQDGSLLSQDQVEATITVEIKMFDIQNAREQLSTYQIGTAMSHALVQDSKSIDLQQEVIKNALQNTCVKLVEPILVSLQRVHWRASIVGMNGFLVYINAGKNSGVLQGDMLRVLNIGPPIFDQSTGEFLGYDASPTRIKGIIKVIHLIGEDAAAAKVESGGQFKPGDTVELY